MLRLIRNDTDDDPDRVDLDRLTVPDPLDGELLDESPAERALWREQQKYVDYFWKIALDTEIDYGVENMLGTAERKIGPKKSVRVFNRSLSATCCKANGEKIATPLCERVCYAENLFQCCPALRYQVMTNDSIAGRDDFADVMIGAIIEEYEKNCSLDIFRIHTIGDFDTTRYINAWVKITETVHRLLDGSVAFLCYTRAWRRKKLMPALTRLNTVPGVHLVLSYDAECERLPPDSEEWATSLLLDEQDKGGPVLDNTLVVFRSRDDRGIARYPMSHFTDPASGQKALVCLHENGIPSGPKRCVECRKCLFREPRDRGTES